MPGADTLEFQNFSTVQSNLQPAPKIIASAATIAPQSFLTILTGDVAVVNITPPLSWTHMLAIQFAGIAGVTAAGNITTLTATVAGQILLLIYNPNTKKYVPVG
jgi:hypothetical protein